MTFVAAKRFDERVLVVCDTMISDPREARSDRIPGRLKAVILDGQTTVAYAGLADQGIDAIRLVKQILSKDGTLAEVESALTKATECYGDELDFLLISHRDGVSLKRIWEGRVSSNLNQACIGQRDLLPTLLSFQSDVPRSVVPHEFEEESPFTSAFQKLFDGTYISSSVGGFGFLTTCSPYGHCYNNAAGVVSWDTISFPPGVTNRQLADRRSGMTQWSYNIQSPTLRGVAVIGAAVLDAGIGYIYAPILSDKPTKWIFPRPETSDQHGPIIEAFQRVIDQKAKEVGGGFEACLPTPLSRLPTDGELQKILSHAEKAPLPTGVVIEEENIVVWCGSPLSNMVRVSCRSLDPDPVWVLTTVIDRMNEDLLAQ